LTTQNRMCGYPCRLLILSLHNELLHLCHSTKKKGCMGLTTRYEWTLPSLWRCSKYSWWEDYYIFVVSTLDRLVRILTEDPSYLLLIINRFCWNN
jgi:hypothetical protein